MTQKNSNSIVPAGYFGQTPETRRPLGNGPFLQWFNGLPAGKALAVGWHIQASRCSEALTAALHAAGYARLTVLHRMTGELVEYWHLEPCSLIVLCNGFSDPWEMRQSAERDGIAYGWIAARNSSKVKARVLIAELAEAGYTEQLTVTLEGMITEDWFKALEQQFRVLDAFEKLAGIVAPFYGFSIPMMPAEKPRMVGSKGKQSPIIPMIAQVPQVVDEDYLAAHLCSKAVLELIVSRDLVGKAVKWSIDTSERINRNEDREEWETPEYEEALRQPREASERQKTQPAAGAKASSNGTEPATAQQCAAIRNLWQKLGYEANEAELEGMTGEEAAGLIRTLSEDYREARRKSNGKR
jgi:hypothetical protein